MKRIGLTGGIGTGKSTVTRLFAAQGWSVIDADAIVHRLLGTRPFAELAAPGATVPLIRTPVVREIAKAFGRKVCAADGAIDRRRLGEIVFADPVQRRLLEAIIHPAVRHVMEKEGDVHARRGTKICLLDIPLLFESNYDWHLDAIIVVTCDEATQLARCREKFAWSDAETHQRIAAQLPLVEKVRRATYVIENSGPVEATKRQVLAVAKRVASIT